MQVISPLFHCLGDISYLLTALLDIRPLKNSI